MLPSTPPPAGPPLSPALPEQAEPAALEFWSTVVASDDLAGQVEVDEEFRPMLFGT